jgi:hypothetical protein
VRGESKIIILMLQRVDKPFKHLAHSESSKYIYVSCNVSSQQIFYESECVLSRFLFLHGIQRVKIEASQRDVKISSDFDMSQARQGLRREWDWSDSACELSNNIIFSVHYVCSTDSVLSQGLSIKV